MDKEQSEKLILNMVNFYTLFEKEFLDLLPEFSNRELSPLLSRMLNEIHIQGKTTSSNLSKRLDLSVPNTSRSVNTLFKLGYITKVQDLKDKRIVYLSLSEKGLELILKYIYASQEKFLEKFNVLSQSEIKELTDSFSTIKNVLLKMRNANNAM